jgi:hypothetical protein
MSQQQHANGHSDTNTFHTRTERLQESGPSQPRAAQGRPDGLNDPGYLREVIRDELDEETVEAIQNLTSRNFVLGQIGEDREHEITWLVRNMVDLVKAQFPPPESSIRGEYRAALLEDDRDQKQPLKPYQERLIEQAVWAFLFDISRSKDGFQQEKLSDAESTSRRIVEDNRGSDRYSIFG